MVESIRAKIWELSPAVHDPEIYAELTSLTRQLIAIYDQDGRLDENPFTPTTKRKLSLPNQELEMMLNDNVCLVTGFGCVGQCLIEKLSFLGIKQIVVMDIKPLSEDVKLAANVVYVQGNISED